MDKKLLIVANWKANKVEVTDWLQQFAALSAQMGDINDQVEVVVAAPTPLLFLLAASNITAAQDISEFSGGAYTGETTGEVLKEVDVSYCLIGHSERRKYFGENNGIVAKKFAQALAAGITPIVCAQSWEEIPEEVRAADTGAYYLMYEPFSAISTDGQYHAESGEAVDQVLLQWQAKLPPDVRLLYGGSVNPENVSDYVKIELVSGFVVGHASLDPNEFFSIINKCLSPKTFS